MPMTPSACALDKLIRKDPVWLRRLKPYIHRTLIWEYRTGRAIPGGKTASDLEALTGGLVPANGWTNNKLSMAHGRALATGNPV